MMLSIKSLLFLLLLPIFFVLHGFVANYDFVPAIDALLLVAMYIGAALLFWIAGYFLLRDSSKAALLSFYLLSFHFFFGTIHDSLKKMMPGSFITKYIVLTGLALLLFITIFILLKKRKKPLNRLRYFLNLLLIILISIDLCFLFFKMVKSGEDELPNLPVGFKNCNDCPKPDIYFIIADEYVGNSTLKEKFNFDNSSFTAELANRGFHTIPYSRSNYNFTPFSVASTLDMSYLPIGKGDMNSPSDVALCYQTIKNNRLLRFLQSQGYQFYNHSIFDFEGQPARQEVTFLPNKTKLITSQTFLSRIERDIRFNLVTKLKSEKELKRLTYGYLHNNENNYRLTLKVASSDVQYPRFVFSHLHMPHYPYYFDKDGKEQPFESLLEGQQVNKENYTGYLQYSNKKYLALIDDILKKSKQPPVIVLLGDHGFRHFAEPADDKYLYLNHASVLLPGKEYTAFNDSLTNVNFFTTFLNTAFKQQLPLLPDSTIFINQ